MTIFAFIFAAFGAGLLVQWGWGNWNLKRHEAYAEWLQMVDASFERRVDYLMERVKPKP